jgi:hypothetical protein
MIVSPLRTKSGLPEPVPEPETSTLPLAVWRVWLEPGSGSARRVERGGVLLGVAALCFLTGRLGLLLAMPGGPVTWKIAPMPQVKGDRAMLRLILTNLIGNALKYPPPAGPGRDRGWVQHGVRGQTVRCVSTAASGGGFRWHGHRIGQCRADYPAAWGRTWAEGAVNAGATFYFSLPEMPEKQAETPLRKDF